MKKGTAGGKNKGVSGEQIAACLAQKGSTAEQGTHQSMHRKCILFADTMAKIKGNKSFKNSKEK